MSELEGRAALMSLPPAFDGIIDLSNHVSPLASSASRAIVTRVPCCGLTRPHQGPRTLNALCQSPFSISIYPDRLVVTIKGNMLCQHLRVIQRCHLVPLRTIYDQRHYLAVLQCRPGALPNRAPLAEFLSAIPQPQDAVLPMRQMEDLVAAAKPGGTSSAVIARGY
jgi:hypothetical protein